MRHARGQGNNTQIKTSRSYVEIFPLARITLLTRPKVMVIREGHTHHRS